MTDPDLRLVEATTEIVVAELTARFDAIVLATVKRVEQGKDVELYYSAGPPTIAVGLSTLLNEKTIARVLQRDEHVGMGDL